MAWGLEMFHFGLDQKMPRDLTSRGWEFGIFEAENPQVKSHQKATSALTHIIGVFPNRLTKLTFKRPRDTVHSMKSRSAGDQILKLTRFLLS